MKNLYHGTVYYFNEIDLKRGKGYKDFGRGFYATAVKSHAESIAKRNKNFEKIKYELLRRKNPSLPKRTFTAYRYNLVFDDTNLSDLNVKIFTEADLDWVKFVLLNRQNSNTVHNYDIVIGPTADENTVTIINSYKHQLLSTNYSEDVLLKLINDLEPENLPKQYFFATQKSLTKLKFSNCRMEIIE